MNFVTQLLPPRLVEALGWTLFHSLWQGALAALAFAVVLYFSRRTSARLRYGLGLLVLALILLLSLFTFWTHYSIFGAVPTIQSTGPAVAAGTGSAGVVGSPAAASARVGPTRAQRIAAFFSDYFGRHLPLIVTLWLLGVLFLSLRFTGGMLYVQRLKYRQNRPLPEPWPGRLQALAGKAGLRRPLRLLESLRLRTPVVIGHLKPVLLLPVGLVAGLPADEVEALLAHELAHVMRRDYLVNVLQNLVDILFFFHPGLRWISACVRQEREHCCDDFAVALCGDPRPYARALARLQEGAGGFPEPALAAAGPRRGLLRRIARLLGRPRLAHDFREGFASALLLVLGLLGMLRMAVAAGSNVPASGTAGGSVQPLGAAGGAALLVAGTERKPGPSATEKPRPPSLFELLTFALESDATVELAGRVVVGPGGPPTSWLLDRQSGEVVWYMASAGKAKEGEEVLFSEEIALGSGLYGWYLPVGCTPSARRKDASGKGPWRGVKLRSAVEEPLVERRSSGGEMVRAEREEELLRRKEENHRLQEDLTRAEAERGVREDEARLRAGEEKLRQEERAMRLEEAERLRAEKERLGEEELRARSDEERKRLDAELKRTEEELRKQEQELSVQEKLLQAQVQRLKVEEENFKKFLAELVKAGLVSEADGYRIKLSAAALVINGKKQPREVFEKYRQLYESLTGTQVEGKRTITFVNEKD